MEKQIIRTFGRRHGKRLSARQQWLLDNLLPIISPKNIEKAGKDNTTTPTAFAATPSPAKGNYILEIGFGNGEHLRDIAIEYPENIIVGAEPFMNGVASLLSAITNETDNSVMNQYKNIRVWADDVRKLLDDTDLKFNQIYVLHPDPWPKARHEKRRLLNSDFLNMLSSRLTQYGQIIIGTDHHEYYDWIIDQLPNTDLKIKTTDMEIIQTRYQQKNKAGTDAPKYLVLAR